jgi:lipopolysaccharide transport system permease protein
LGKELETDWTLEIKPTNSWLDIGLRDVWQYRDLLWLFVKRDIVTIYQQTVLGVFWFFIPPILTTITYILIFSGVAKIPTNGAPPALFYMSGIVIWGYFSECFNRTSGTFSANAGIFGKVYFPRLVAPMSAVISSLFKFVVQFSLFLAIYVYYYFKNPCSLTIDSTLFLLPFLVLLMAIIGMGTGMIFSSLTTKYRDFTFLLGFGMQLLMYATPVIYPTSFIPEKFRFYALLNPLSSIVESFRSVFLHSGSIPFEGLAYSTVFALVCLVFGMLIFTKVEKSFMDTI